MYLLEVIGVISITHSNSFHHVQSEHEKIMRRNEKTKVLVFPQSSLPYIFSERNLQLLVVQNYAREG